MIQEHQPYFEAIGNEGGFNGVKENPCKLLDFGLVKLEAGQEWKGATGDNELVAVVLGGTCSVMAGEEIFENIGQRANVFGGKAYAVYAPPDTSVAIKGVTGVEVALCFAKAKPNTQAPQPFLIKPEEMGSGVWGAANFSRNFQSILVETSQPVQRLIVGETYTPSGHWSTYPPHKHEQEVPGKEVFMEEFYYFKSSAPDGFGLCKHYTDDGSIDNVYTVRDNTLLKVSKGYHTYVEAPGYTGYYLWFLAGDHRNQLPQVDPSLEWVQKEVSTLRQFGL